eukprot:5903913-Prymnesium_polylepis.1
MRWVALPALTTLVVVVTGQSLAARYDLLVHEATTTLESGELHTAHRKIEELLSEYPKDTTVLSLASAVASARGQHAAAAARLDALLRHLPYDDSDEQKVVLQLAREMLSMMRPSTAHLLLQQLLSRTSDPRIMSEAQALLAAAKSKGETLDTIAIAMSTLSADNWQADNRQAMIVMPLSPNKSASGEPAAASGEGASRRRPRLVIFVHTCTAFEQSRAAVLARTWANGRSDVVFITDN